VENRVRRLRRVRGLTQQDFGALLGVSRQTVNAIENGRYEPGLRLALNIARVFAARIEDVFRLTDETKPDWGTVMIRIPDLIRIDGLVLRPHMASDLSAFQRFLADPEATRFMAFTCEQKTPEGAAAMMDAVIESYASDTPICSLTIADAGDGHYLGAVGGAEAGRDAMEVFVTVMPEAQGRGIATLAVQALADHLFSTSGATELRADIVAGNGASVRLFEKLGFRKAGPVERAASEGAFAGRDMQGIRYVLTARAHTKRKGGTV